MGADPFASGTVSTVLAWISVLPLLLGLLVEGGNLLWNAADDDMPRWFILWLFACLIFLSPLRYIVLMVMMGISYTVQSWHAFATLFALALYVPIVFGLLYAVGLVLPIAGLSLLAFRSVDKPVVTRGRLIVGAVAAPLCMIAGSLLFAWVLPLAGKSVHWLDAKDVIGATNGPALFVYEHGLKYGLPLPVAGYYVDVTQTDRDFLRNHVASFYLGRGAEATYVKAAYPALYQSLTQP